MTEQVVSSAFQPVKDLWKVIAGSNPHRLNVLPSIRRFSRCLALQTVSTGAALSDTLYWGEDGYGWFRPLDGARCSRKRRHRPHALL